MFALNHLDTRTAYLIAGLAALLCGFTLVLLRKHHLPMRRAALTMAAAMMGLGLSFVMASARDANTSDFSIWFGLTCEAAGFALMLEATRQLAGKAADYRISSASVALQAAALILVSNPKATLLLHYGFQMVHCLLMIVIMLRAQHEVARVSRYGMTLLMTCFALATTSRWFEALYASEIALRSPTLSHASVSGLVVVLYALSPIVIMIHVLATLNAHQVGERTHAASTDELTGLASRRFLLSTAGQWRQSAEGQNHLCALLLIDVDNFKAINDHFGHEVGDEVLRHLARTLNSNLRADAVLARYGGEEFCALLPIERPAEAKAAAERLRIAVESKHFRKGVTQIKLTVSVGVAMHGSAQSLQQVLRVADRRVHLAKDLGRNCVVSDDPAAKLELEHLPV